MKKIFLIILLFFGSFISKADTIDVWHVYYNKIKIKEYTDYNKGKIQIKAKQFKNGDKIIVRHFDDTPCQDCEIFLFIEDGKRKIESKAKGEGKPLSILVKDLIELNKKKKTVFKVYYSGSYLGEVNPKKMLFEIEII
jgi:hypothetical protein